MAPAISMPQHPSTGLYAIGVTSSGKPIWPVMGGEESADAAAQAAAAAQALTDKAATDAATQAAVDKERGFPSNTKVDDMEPLQQAAYWRFHSRKHEGRASAFGNLTADELAELRDKAKKADDLEAAKGTDTERAIRSAQETATTATEGKFQPLLVEAKFEAAVARRDPTGERMPADKLATILAPLDMKHFLAADGTVDTVKVNDYVAGILPAEPSKQKGPSANGQGQHGGGNAQGSAADRARARAERLGIRKPEPAK